jgi:glyoxylase-like metal-dependent hydrolase (beta-lactamase superfamily II)
MREIAPKIHIEDQYLGVTLGVITTTRGLIQVDAPPLLEDGRSWRASLLNLGGGAERLLINLDAHPDRTLGTRSMECMVIVQEKTAQVFRNRPTAFKPQADDTGADWETVPSLGNIRWMIPEITFSHQMEIHWGEKPVLLENHAGPSVGAIWVAIPDEKVVFVGDAVVLNQPPFLAGSDIPAWVESLKILLSPAYRGYLIVAGRGGVATGDDIRFQLNFLNTVQSKLEKMASKKSVSVALDNLLTSLLTDFKVPNNRQGQYTQRLRHGLLQYYYRHFQNTNLNKTEE